MKRLFLLATIVLSNYACANAQGTYQYSGDYLYSPFNDYSCTTHILSGSCPYWWEDDCPNGFEGWKRAHGTPSAATDPVTGLVDRVYMWGQTVTQNSEGIYHPFVFRQGGLYNIYLGIAGMNVTTGGRIEVWAINDVDQWFLAYGTTPTICGGIPLPYTSFFTTPDISVSYVPQKLGEYVIGSTAITSLQEKSFQTPPLAHDYNNILIMVVNDGLGSNPPQENVILDYVRVCSYGDQTYFTPGHIPIGLISKNRIFSGGVYANPSNPALSPTISNDPDRITDLRAVYTIIEPPFYATANGADNYLIIRPRECCYYLPSVTPPPSEDGGEAGTEGDGAVTNLPFCYQQSKPESSGGNSDNSNIDITALISAPREGMEIVKSSRHIEIYPNPANTVLTVSGVTNADYTFADVTGRVLLTGQLVSPNIDVSSLAPGNYVLTITMDNQQKEHFKIMKQ